MNPIPISGLPIFVPEDEHIYPVATKIGEQNMHSKNFVGVLDSLVLDCQLKDLPQGDFVYQDFPNRDVEILAKMVSEL